MTSRRETLAPQIVVIGGDGGGLRENRWAHASIRAQLTNPTPQEVSAVRRLVEEMVDVMAGSNAAPRRRKAPYRRRRTHRHRTRPLSQARRRQRG